MITNGAHPQICVRVPDTSIFSGKSEAVKASVVSYPASLGQEIFPCFGRKTSMFPAGPGMFTSVIKKSFVVVQVLKGEDGCVNEVVEKGDIVLKGRRKLELHIATPYVETKRRRKRM